MPKRISWIGHSFSSKEIVLKAVSVMRCFDAEIRKVRSRTYQMQTRISQNQPNILKAENRDELGQK